MSSYDAKRQFDENLRLFGNSKTEPEKFNLYSGLSNLARGLMDNENQLSRIESKMDAIMQGLNRR